MPSLVGIPFAEKGRDYDGADCWGLARLYYRDLGIDLPDYSEYTGSKDEKAITGLIFHYRTEWQDVTEPKRNDLILFSVAGVAMHIGVYLGSNKFLHTEIGSASTIQKLTSIKWKRRVDGFYRHV